MRKKSTSLIEAIDNLAKETSKIAQTGEHLSREIDEKSASIIKEIITNSRGFVGELDKKNTSIMQEIHRKNTSVIEEIAENNRALISSIDNLSEHIHALAGSIKLPNLSIGPYEEVLIFNVEGHVHLHVPSRPPWYFHIIGVLTDIYGKEQSGSEFEMVFPFNPRQAPEVILTWPDRQGGPFDRPQLDSAHTDRLGFSKTNFVFSDGGSIATVGSSVPKLTPLPDGAAQLWVASVGVITDGTGKYEGVRGLGSYNGSSFYETSPSFENPPSGLQQLIDGFRVKVEVCFKLYPQTEA